LVGKDASQQFATAAHADFGEDRLAVLSGTKCVPRRRADQPVGQALVRNVGTCVWAKTPSQRSRGQSPVVVNESAKSIVGSRHVAAPGREHETVRVAAHSGSARRRSRRPPVGGRPARGGRPSRSGVGRLSGRQSSEPRHRRSRGVSGYSTPLVDVAHSHPNRIIAPDRLASFCRSLLLGRRFALVPLSLRLRPFTLRF
jgi:hypothetical protein